MVDGRLAQQWQQASTLMAAMYNSQPGRTTPVKPRQLNPYQGMRPREDDHDLDDFFGLDDED